jgi:hypothetical protein
LQGFSISKLVFILIGLVAFLLGIVTGTMQIVVMFSQERIFAYNSMFPNSLSGAAQQMSILYTNLWLAMAGVMSGLLFMAPVKIGRAFRAAGYTTPDVEVVPKAYRAGGIYLVIGGILALAARLFVGSSIDNLEILVLILPIIFIGLGVCGLVAGLVKAK